MKSNTICLAKESNTKLCINSLKIILFSLLLPQPKTTRSVVCVAFACVYTFERNLHTLANF